MLLQGMSAKNGKVCCNCRHCVRSRDEKYDLIVCHCDVYKMYMSYSEVMDGWCKHWSRERREK